MNDRPCPLALFALACLAAGPATTPAARSPQDILREMTAAKSELATAIGDPKNMGDPAKRAAIAPRAIPALRRLLADVPEFDAATGRPPTADAAFDLQLRAILSALGDQPSTDLLARMAADPAPARAVRGHLGQRLAQWVQVPGDGPGQMKVADGMAALDAEHPADNELAYFTGTLALSAATPPVQVKLRAALDGMTAPAAAALRQRLVFPATAPATGPAAGR